MKIIGNRLVIRPLDVRSEGAMITELSPVGLGEVVDVSEEMSNSDIRVGMTVSFEPNDARPFYGTDYKWLYNFDVIGYEENSKGRRSKKNS